MSKIAALSRHIAHILASDPEGAVQAGSVQIVQELQAAYADRRGPAPLRTIHHFACTGGTLLSKCVAVMPCTRLLSEVEPLSEMTLQRPFAPTDLVGLAVMASNPPALDTQTEIFLAGLAVLARETALDGYDLVLRDHSHSHFCFGPNVPDRPSLYALLAPHYALRSLVWVRHPLDSFLSLRQRNWVHFKPATLEEYARRYHLFLDHHTQLESVQYEAFIHAPERAMQTVCALLALDYNPGFQTLFGGQSLSGDSGRSSAVIGARTRRPVEAAVRAMLQAAPQYDALCHRLGYDPDPDAAPLIGAPGA